MKRLDLKVGFSCNSRCVFCAQGHRRNQGDNSTEELKEEMKESREDGAEMITFTGGEPTIRDDIIDLVAYADDLGYDIIQIQSNGRMFSYMEFSKKIVEAGANEFSPAIHGHKPEVHEAGTRAEGSWKQCYQGIKNLKELDQYVITNTVVTKINYEYLPEITKMLMDLEVDQFQFAFVHPVGWADENFYEVVPKKSKVEPYVHEALDLAEEHPHEPNNIMVEAFPYCFMQGYEEYVSQLYMPDTEIKGQEHVIEDHEEVRKEWDKAKAGKCRECKYFEICEGPWKEYPREYGFDEFEPVEGERIESKEEVVPEEKKELVH
ncbi:MAG: radical SAM protein [Candidatus Nanohaloarchaeota archaeon QJJ-7]|nr:radical SAM protein [Candidatus Nanohaloarchaeota archaeon QJJ-7]